MLVVERLVSEKQALDDRQKDAGDKVATAMAAIRERLKTLESGPIPLGVAEWPELLAVLTAPVRELSEKDRAAVAADVTAVAAVCETETTCGAAHATDLRRELLAFDSATRALSRLQDQLDGVRRNLRRYGVGPGQMRVYVAKGPEPAIALGPQRIREQCLQGMEVGELGKDLELKPLLDQEGSAGSDDGPKERRLVRVSPGDAFLFLLLEYEGAWDIARHVLVRRCSRLRFFREAPVTSIEFSTLGYGNESQNRVDLLPVELKELLANRLETNVNFIVPVRKLIRYKASRAAEEVLRDGQEIEIIVRRSLADPERDADTSGGGEKPYILRWTTMADEMPRLFLSTQVLVGLAPGQRTSDKNSFFSAGPAAILTYRFTGREYYIGAGPFVYVGRATGEMNANAPQGLRSMLFGAGVQLDFSGYVGIGGSAATDADVGHEDPPIPWTG